MHRREMAFGKCIIGPGGIAQRARSPMGPPGPMMHFRGPWSQAPPSQAPFARLCFLSAWWLANFYVIYILYGSAQPKRVLERKYSPYFEDENIFQKSAFMVQIIMKYRIEQRRPIFDSPQNKTKIFLRGSLVKLVGVGKLFVWDFPYYNLAPYSLHTNLVIFKLP